MTEKKISESRVAKYHTHSLDKAIVGVAKALESYSLLPQNLKRMRQAKGMTQEDLAKKIGTTYHTIHRYEAGYCDPSEARLEKLANALGCPVEYFFLQDTTWDNQQLTLRADAQENTLCEKCMHLYGGSICDGKKPIPGWAAKKKVTKYKNSNAIVSYKVLSCPLFEQGRVHPLANDKYLKTANHY